MTEALEQIKLLIRTDSFGGLVECMAQFTPAHLS